MHHLYTIYWTPKAYPVRTILLPRRGGMLQAQVVAQLVEGGVKLDARKCI